MGDNDVDISAEAAQDAAAAAAQEVAAQEAMEAAQQEAFAQAQDMAAEDDGLDLADLAAEEGDPFDQDVEDIEESDDADVSEPEVEETEPESAQSTKDAAPAPMSEDAFVPDETESVQSETEFQPEPNDNTEVVTSTATRPESQAASAVMAQSEPSSKARADALTSMSSADFRRRLRDEQVKHSGGLVANEGYMVRSQLDQARRRGAELGLLDEEALKQFDDEMAYSDSTLDEDQRSAYGPGSPMYEEAKRLGYIVEGDRTSGASSMRIRDVQDARREAEERLRFHHYWQQQAARDYLSAVKAVMQAEDADNGAGAGFSQLGRLLADLTVGDGVDEAELDEYIAAQSDESDDDAAEDTVVTAEPTAVTEDTVEPEQTSLSDSDLDDLDVAIEEYAKERERHCAEIPPSFDEISSDPFDPGFFEDAPVSRDDAVDNFIQNIEKKEDTPVTIQEFIDAWEQFSTVERRIILRRTGLVNADEMEEVYTELQETVQTRTDERDRYREECNQLKADLEYETGVRRDAEREVAQLRNSVSARGPRG